jgi:hypothetical protein
MRLTLCLYVSVSRLSQFQLLDDLIDIHEMWYEHNAFGGQPQLHT